MKKTEEYTKLIYNPKILTSTTDRKSLHWNLHHSQHTRNDSIDCTYNTGPCPFRHRNYVLKLHNNTRTPSSPLPLLQRSQCTHRYRWSLHLGWTSRLQVSSIALTYPHDGSHVLLLSRSYRDNEWPAPSRHPAGPWLRSSRQSPLQTVEGGFAWTRRFRGGSSKRQLKRECWIAPRPRWRCPVSSRAPHWPSVRCAERGCTRMPPASWVSRTATWTTRHTRNKQEKRRERCRCRVVDRTWFGVSFQDHTGNVKWGL